HSVYSLIIKPTASHQCRHSFPTRRSSDLQRLFAYDTYLLCRPPATRGTSHGRQRPLLLRILVPGARRAWLVGTVTVVELLVAPQDRKSTRLNSSHVKISYAVFCSKKKNS